MCIEMHCVKANNCPIIKLQAGNIFDCLLMVQLMCKAIDDSKEMVQKQEECFKQTMQAG